MVTSVLDYSNPQSIYEFVNEQIKLLVHQLDSLEYMQMRIGNQQEHIKQSKDIIQNLQRNIQQAIQQYQTNAEWDIFQIALFGETNAGKSTIIETMRILLKETTKINQQQKFNQLIQQLDLSSEKYYSNQKLLLDIQSQLQILHDEKSTIEQKYQSQISEIEQEEFDTIKEFEKEISISLHPYISKLQEKSDKKYKLEKDIKKIKSQMSWWLKLIYIFKKLDEEKLLLNLLKEIKDIESKKENQLSKLNNQKNISIIKPYAQKKDVILQAQHNELQPIMIQINEQNKNQTNINKWFNDFNSQKKKLIPFADGNIIGDGRSDYTQKSASYQFTINNYDVCIIDVPGIEGNEKSVQNEISKTVQKAHAVFYVTSKDATPNEGTLQRIHKYLNEQTEVWAIYNKQITNPRQLKNNLIQNEDEINSLNELETTLLNSFNEHYQGLLTVAGLPAFLSQAQCLEPFSIMEEQQKKFLNKHDRESLYELSQLNSLENTLQNKVLNNIPEKIRISNFNKVKKLLEHSHLELSKVHDTYMQFEHDLSKKIEITAQSIIGHFEEFKMSVKGQTNNLIDQYQQNVREEMYSIIDRNISNDDFKSSFNRVLKSRMQDFEIDTTNLIEKLANKLENNIIQSHKELISQANELSKDYKQFSQLQNLNFQLNFQIDSGINKMGLLSVAIGAGVAMWWNPVGWMAISLTVAGLVISFVKSVIGFFSSSYKMEQQRKNVNSNLPRVTSQIKSSLDESLDNLFDNLIESRSQILSNLDGFSVPIQNLNLDLKNSLQSLEDISSKIN